MPKYANQFIIIKQVEAEKDAAHPYMRLSISALEKASKDLNGMALKLYLFLAKNEKGFEFGLSPAAAASWGISEKSCRNARQELIDKGYLIQVKDGVFAFCEEPRADWKMF